jgi:cyclopropane fatty-acyl-phospholipid synthase-like methyltransferase
MGLRPPASRRHGGRDPAGGQIPRVVQYYNSTSIAYRTLWTGRTDLAMHFGYYDRTARTHRDSLLRMNEVLAMLAGVRAGDYVLDAGCGYGGTVLWLAEHVGCRASGVNIVPSQVRRARRAARRRGLESGASFWLLDYADTGFPDSSFDVVWGLESVVHAQSKEKFVREAYRLLKPGGRLLISEYMLRDSPPLTVEERAHLRPWLAGWAMPSLLAPSEYELVMRRAGFGAVEAHDLTGAVLPSLNRLERIASRVQPLGRVLHAARILGDVEFGNLVATLRKMKALKSGLWSYIVLVARKDA